LRPSVNRIGRVPGAPDPPPRLPTGTYHAPDTVYFWKSPSPPNMPPFRLASISCRLPTVGNIGWSSAMRVMPKLTELCTPGGSENRLLVSPSSKFSYFVRDSE